jgi:antitoxin CcdA
MRMLNAHFTCMPETTPAAPRRATNVTLPEPLLHEARDLGINLSQACERGLAIAVAAARRQRWLEENQGALAAWNEHVVEHGLPLAAYRQF